jgi:small subunit ribosomal protein S6
LHIAKKRSKKFVLLKTAIYAEISLLRVGPGLESVRRITNMRKYETIFILHPELSEDDIKSVTAKAQDVISTFKGECFRMDDWGIRKLAYPIKKSARGRYYYLRFDGESALIAELERRLRLDDKVLRYQSVNITDLPERAAAEKKAELPEAVTEESAEEISAAEETPAAEEAAE